MVNSGSAWAVYRDPVSKNQKQRWKCYVYKTEYYSTIKENQILVFTGNSGIETIMLAK